MMLKSLASVDGDLATLAWRVYHACFSQLETRAYQRHLMTPSEFTAQMQDERVDKLLVLDDAGQVVALATVTTDLAAVPLLSLPFFEDNYSDAYASGRIIYVPLIAAADHDREAFKILVEHVYYLAITRGCLVGMDVCRFNDLQRHFVRVIELITNRLGDEDCYVVTPDEQSLWLFDPSRRNLAGNLGRRPARPGRRSMGVTP